MKIISSYAWLPAAIKVELITQVLIISEIFNQSNSCKRWESKMKFKYK